VRNTKHFAFLFCFVSYGQIHAPINGPTSICVGSTVTFNDATPSGTPANERQLDIFPNPNKGVFTIKGAIGVPIAIGNDEVSVVITDMIGQVVYKDVVTMANGNINAQVILSNGLARGVYMLGLRSGKESRVLYFVIE
jgi:hypothetical protein